MDVNAGGGVHGSPLCVALAEGHEVVVQLLLEKDAVRATLRRGHLYTEILLDRGKPNRCDTLTQW